MLKTRPKNLNLLSIAFPLPAIVSILHRISGLFLFVCLPFLLFLFNYSLESENGFLTIRDYLQLVWVKLLVWLFLAMLCYHFIAGVRHLLLDWHLGETKCGGKISAKIAVVVAIIAIVLVGVWLW